MKTKHKAAAPLREPRDHLMRLPLLRLCLVESLSVVVVGPGDNLTLDRSDVDALVELLDAVLDDRDIREKYWHPLACRAKSQRTISDWGKQWKALYFMDTVIREGKRSLRDIYEDAATHSELTFDQVESLHKTHFKLLNKTRGKSQRSK